MKAEKQMIDELVEKHSLFGDDVNKVLDLLTKVNSTLKNYSIGIRPSKDRKNTWEEINIFIETKDGKEVKSDMYTDYIHIDGDIKKIFAHLFLYNTIHKLYI